MQKSDLARQHPLYVYTIPSEILSTLTLHGNVPAPSLEASDDRSVGNELPAKTAVAVAPTCSTCKETFANIADQRSHFRSDWHNYNLRQHLRGLKSVSEAAFDATIGDLDSSLSGSNVSSSEDDERASQSAQASSKREIETRALETRHESTDSAATSKTAGSPLAKFRSSLLPRGFSMGIYRAIFKDQQANVERLLQMQLRSPVDPKPTTPLQHTKSRDRCTFLLMIGGGHCAAAIISLVPQTTGNATHKQAPRPNVLHHKTFHRYTTRRKQGGAQSANDSAKGAAHSAGAGIRRYNEAALRAEVRALLAEWKAPLASCETLFIRATGSMNRHTILGPYDHQIISAADSRLRSFPFSTRRPTMRELLRAFKELTETKLLPDQAEGIVSGPSDSKSSISTVGNIKAAIAEEAARKLSPEEEEALMHTNQLEALIRRSKAAGVVAYLKTHSLSADFEFSPTASHPYTPFPLHLATKGGSTAVVSSLLLKCGADPTRINAFGKVAFDLATDEGTKVAFRVARSELGEEAWDWQQAKCGPALTRIDAEAARERSDVSEAAREHERRQEALSQLKVLDLQQDHAQSGGSRPSKTFEANVAERREVERRGLTADAQRRLERERRARAAEERLRKN